jgi:hypothetical protein
MLQLLKGGWIQNRLNATRSNLSGVPELLRHFTLGAIGYCETLLHDLKRPVFDALVLWLKAKTCKIYGKTKQAEAIRYAM